MSTWWPRFQWNDMKDAADWMNQWTGSTKQWTHGWMSEVRWEEVTWGEVRWGDWLSDWVTERFSDWATEWLTEYVRACVSELERPLRWGASSRSYFFSGQPLICTTSALNCLPATGYLFCSLYSPILLFAASKVRFATSPYNPAQYKSSTMIKVAVPLMLSEPCQCVLTHHLQTRIAGVSRKSTIATLRDNGNDSTLLWTPEVLRFLLQSGAHFSDPIFQTWPGTTANRALAVSCACFRPRLPEVQLGTRQPLTVQTDLSLQSRALSVGDCPSEARTRGNTDRQTLYFCDPGATIPIKRQGFAPSSVFTCESSTSEVLLSSAALTHELLSLPL